MDELVPVEGAKEFMEALRYNGIPYVIITDRSARSRERLAATMNEMGFKFVRPSRIYTSVMGAVDFAVWQFPEKRRAYFIGGTGLRTTLEEVQFEISRLSPDLLFIGMNRNMDYHDYSDAAYVVRKGAQMISTDSRMIQYQNGDAEIGNGAIVRMLEASTGKVAIDAGMGSDLLIMMTLRYMRVQPEDVIAIGTDFKRHILPAARCGIETMFITHGRSLMESGITEELHPTYMVEDLYGLCK